MFEAVSKGFRSVKDKLKGQDLTEALVDEAVRDIRLSLLEADVEFSVVKSFIGRVKARAQGEIVAGSVEVDTEAGTAEITAYHRFIAICSEELEALMGTEEMKLDYAPMGVTAVMVVGLQGSGKTTTVAKMARFMRERDEKSSLMVAADLARPAAIEQLERLGEQVEVPVFSQRGGTPLSLCGEALAKAGRDKKNVVIFDTAGRLAIDAALMEELKLIKDRTKPQEILLVIDSMIGQDAVKTAKAFDEALGLTGIVLTKLDGDARGGAALSVRAVTGKPIKFLGMGEGMEALEPFRAEGIASRILGMGDVVGLVQDFERHVDADKADEDAERMFRGQFDLNDFVEQIRTLRKLGSLEDLLEKMPMLQDAAAGGLKPDEREFLKIEAVYNSMTPRERRRPALMGQAGRIARVAAGCGRAAEQVKDVLNRFDAMRRMMIALGDKPSLLTKIPGFDQLAQVRKLRGLDMAELFGDMFDPSQLEPEPAPAPAQPRAPARREYFDHLPPPKNAPPDRKKKKAKDKAARKAKKRNRR